MKDIYQKLLPPKDHIKNVLEFIYSLEDYSLANYKFIQWLKISEQISNVELFYTDVLDETLYCGIAYGYELNKTKHSEKVILNFTKFLYLFNGFEQLVNTLI